MLESEVLTPINLVEAAFSVMPRSDIADIDDYSPLKIRLFRCPVNDDEAVSMGKMFS